MNDYKLSKWEQETVVCFNREERKAVIYTCDPVIMRRMDRLVEQYPDHYTQEREETFSGDVISRTYNVDKRYIRFAKPVVYTPEKRAEMAARGRALYEKHLAKKTGDKEEDAGSASYEEDAVAEDEFLADFEGEDIEQEDDLAYSAINYTDHK